MTNKSLVSIIVPTYNYEHYLPFTLDCLLHQSYQQIEIIVVDDGSKDNTNALVQKYLKTDSRIRYFYQENRGLSAARNLGIYHAKGVYVQFLDADDLVSASKIELQVKHLDLHPELYVSYTAGYYFADGNLSELFNTLFLTKEEWMPKLKGGYYETMEELLKRNIMPVNSTLIRKTTFEKIGLFHEALKSMEDWDIWLRCAMLGLRFQYLGDDRAYALIRVHKNSMSQDRSRMFNYELGLRLGIKKWISESSMLNPAQVEALNKLNSRNILKLVSLLIRSGGLFQLEKLFELLKKTGVKLLFKAYLKTLNDLRKGDSAS